MLKRTIVRSVPWLAVIATVSALSYNRMVADDFDQLQRRRDEAINLATKSIDESLELLRHDLFLLANHTAMDDAIANPTELALTQLSELFVVVMGVRQGYDQVRWIDETGQERVRCDPTPDGVSCNPADGLQSKADRYYFTQTMQLDAGDVYVSELDLNREYGRLQQPDKPVLRIATQLHDAARNPRGIVIINALMKDVLDALQRIRTTVGINLYLTDAAGRWLVGERPEDAFAHEHGIAENTLFARYPRIQAELNGIGGSDFSDSSGVWHFEQVPISRALGAFASDPSKETAYWLVAHTPAETLNSVRLQALLLTVPLAVILAAIVVFFAMRFARDAKARELSAIALGRYADDLSRMNSELKETLSRMARMRTELIDAKRLSSLGLMIAGVAHELNTPVGAAMMTATAIRQRLDSLAGAEATPNWPVDGPKLLKRTDQGTALILENLARVAERISRLRRLSVDRATADCRVFNIADLVEDVLRSLDDRINSARVKVERDIPQDLLLNGYPGPLGQVLENLVSNAVFHAFERQSGRTIRITAVSDTNDVLITVADNGKGISEADRTQIFDPFFTTRRGEHRMGLGLYLTQHFTTEVMGGQLTVASKLGEGTRFTIILPLVLPTQPAATNPMADA
jgi:signal transduction histidine kinase